MVLGIAFLSVLAGIVATISVSLFFEVTVLESLLIYAASGNLAFILTSILIHLPLDIKMFINSRILQSHSQL